jgi:hypothetical protein
LLKRADFAELEKNAIELYENHLNAIKENAGFTHIIGKLFTELKVPNLFIYGEGTQTATILFVKTMRINHQYIETKSHWVLFEPKFIEVLKKFIAHTLKT